MVREVKITEKVTDLIKETGKAQLGMTCSG